MSKLGGQAATYVGAVRTVWDADRRGTVVASGLQVLTALSGLGVVLASKLALDQVTGDSETARRDLVLALTILALSIAITQSLGVVQALQQRLLAEQVDQHVWNDLLDTTVSVDLASWQRSHYMDRLDRVRANALQRPTQVVTALFALAGSTLTAAALVLALFTLQPLLIPLLLAAGVPAVVVARLTSRQEFRFSVVANPIERRRFYYKRIMTDRDHAAEIRAFDTSPFLLGRHAEDNDAMLVVLRRHIAVRLRLALVGTASTLVTLTATFALIGYLLQSERISLATAGAAAIGARLLSGQLSSVFASVASLVECAPFLRDLETFNALHDEAGGAGERRDLREMLRLRGIRFSYEGQERPALDGVDLDLPGGRVVALVGENGSGKTTLAKVVAGLFRPDEGSIEWDGDAAVPAADVRASVSVLFQDFVRYQMSAGDNIAIARSDHPDRDAIRAAAARANVADVIEALPQSYDTKLGIELAEGADLSGGQWQRVALARAFYRDSPLIILDEPTSALDPRAEWELFNDVRGVLDGRAALLISHRYSSVQLADYIYVMDQGRIMEHGTHSELMSLPSGRYAELYTLQAAAYLRGSQSP